MERTDGRLFKAIRDKFVTLAGEQLILAQRRHWSAFVFPVIFTAALGFISVLLITTASLFFHSFAILLFAVLFWIIALLSTFIAKSVTDWYFNLYIVTNRKILELSYKPLASRKVNEVLLDQVRCTEIDTKIEGLINEVLDVGDVIVTFDRPTHQEEFVFTRIANPRSVENCLECAFCPVPAASEYSPDSANGNGGPKSWFNKDKNSPRKWRYMEEIIRGSGPAAN